mgnify:CR=1 FL=1
MNYNRFHKPSTTLTNVLNDVFKNNFGELLNADFSANRPAVNIFENENAFGIELAVPGLNKDDFEIKIEKDQLLVSSKKDTSDENKDSKMKFRRREFNFSTFKKSFHLSDQINKEKINAAYENGVLRITLDKKEEAKEKEPRTISIH